jgi:hypothetical protein
MPPGIVTTMSKIAVIRETGWTMKSAWFAENVISLSLVINFAQVKLTFCQSLRFRRKTGGKPFGGMGSDVQNSELAIGESLDNG